MIYSWKPVSIFVMVSFFTLVMAFSIGTNQVYGQGVITPRDNVEESEDQDIEEETDTDEGDSGDDSADLPVPVLFGVPVEGIYDSYGDPRGGGERKHKGLDMMAPVGTPIVSPTDAEVKRIGTWSGAGHFVITEADGKKFRYYHLQEPAEHLEEGDDIDTGNLIGFVGTSGNATEDAPHLHLEIREDGEPRNPYPRVTKNFSLDETMRLLEGVLADAESDDELAAFLADAFADTFARARRQETAVPDPVLADLPENFAELPPLPQQNLTVGDRGDGVRTLQHILINRDYLDINSPTSYFGSLTKTALADYQEDSGIAPASGYYGPITRSRLQGARTKSDTNSQTNQQLTERISQLQKRVKQLQNKL